MMARKVGVFVGSPRRESFNRKMALAMAALQPASMALGIIEIAHLPLYNQDLDDAGSAPGEWILFRETVSRLDAVLFVTPEHNRSVPAPLKNALDVGSRPYGKSAWNGKPGAIVSVSPGALGAFGANHHLRQSLVFLNVPCLQQPEAYIGGATKLFDAEGKLISDSTRDLLTDFLTAFAAWIEAIHPRSKP
jgi:chromate reductase, NAD(P)H dehydrogenase (quinone)